MRKKNRKLRRLRELYPDVRIKLFYARDFRALLLKFGRMALVDELTGTTGQATPPRVAVEAAARAADAAADPAVAALLAVREADAELPAELAAELVAPAALPATIPAATPVTAVLVADGARGPSTEPLGVGAADAAAGGRRGEPVTPACAPAVEAR